MLCFVIPSRRVRTDTQYIKATYPFTFTMFAIAWGALTHGQGYDMAQQTAYLDGTLRWGFDWLMKVPELRASPRNPALMTGSSLRGRLVRPSWQ